MDNKAVIASEKFSMLGEKAKSGESISEAMHRIRVRKFSLPFKEPENIIEQEVAIHDAYYKRHSPFSDMIGSGMPEIIIGLNNNIGEVSLLTATENWMYPFNMEGFISDLSHGTEEFVSTWLSKTQNQDAMQRGSSIIEKLFN